MRLKSALLFGLAFGTLIVIIVLPATGSTVFSSPMSTPAPPATPSGRVATEAEVATARSEWLMSEHAATYDNGLGANTTCARCKSPANWDPSQSAAQETALDCGSCKRVPGQPRPTLSGGVPVAEKEWEHITCEICHIPVGNSYDVDVAFWNEALGSYESVQSVDELCGHCHEGQHGFRVLEEQESSDVHTGMACTDCHGAHDTSSACTDCHDAEQGAGAAEHERHPSVSCSGCHDQEGLSIWQDPDPESAHYGEYITRRFAHTLTSWPSHNLSVEVECRRCHHPLGDRSSSVVPEVGCTACHEHREGAVSLWCIYFQRDPDPLATSEPSSP